MRSREWNEYHPVTGDRFHVRYVRDGPLIVDFSINQWTVDADGVQHEVWRADTAHEEVHEHRFQQGVAGSRRTNRTSILPAHLGGPMQVAVAFAEYNRTMMERSEERRRSWQQT